MFVLWWNWFKITGLKNVRSIGVQCVHCSSGYETTVNTTSCFFMILFSPKKIKDVLNVGNECVQYLQLPHWKATIGLQFHLLHFVLIDAIKHAALQISNESSTCDNFRFLPQFQIRYTLRTHSSWRNHQWTMNKTNLNHATIESHLSVHCSNSRCVLTRAYCLESIGN